MGILDGVICGGKNNLKSMVNLSDAQEKDAVDFVTDCMYSISYLETISRSTFDDTQNHKTLKQFYAEWLQETKSPKVRIPFGP